MSSVSPNLRLRWKQLETSICVSMMYQNVENKYIAKIIKKVIFDVSTSVFFEQYLSYSSYYIHNIYIYIYIDRYKQQLFSIFITCFINLIGTASKITIFDVVRINMNSCKFGIPDPRRCLLPLLYLNYIGKL